MPIKAVLIDLDNTLYEYEKCNQAGLNTVFERLSTIFNQPKDMVKNIFYKARERVKQQLGNTAASHSRFLYFQKTIECLKGSTNVNLTRNIHELFWVTYFNQMELFDGVIDLFNQLKKSGVKIAIVTDLLADIQFKKISKLGIEPYVDFIITSEEAGKDKPADPIFSLALEKLDCSKEDVVFIGDDIKDEQGAKDFGISYIQVNNGDFRNVLEYLNLRFL